MPLDRRFDGRGIAAVADDHSRGPGADVLEHDRVDRRPDRAEPAVADDADDGDVCGPGARLEQFAFEDLADRVVRRFEAELLRGILVDHHVHAAPRKRDLLILIGREVECHVVGRTVRVEPAAGEEL